MKAFDELLEYLEAGSVHLYVGIDYPTRRRRLRVVQDPHGVIDDLCRRLMAEWEPYLIAALYRRVKVRCEGYVPDTVKWGPNAAGLPVLEYPRPDGTRARFIQRHDGSWFPCSPPQEVSDGNA